MRPENAIGEPFIELGEVDSSNNYAIRKAQAQMAEHGVTWFAHYQNSGKGQRGKAWNAEAGQNIMMSSILTPSFLNIDNQFILNITVALACFDFFTAYAKGDTSIKWPNDIYWKDRKAGGLLIENIVQGKKLKFCIAGIGININQTLFPDSLPNPVSLKQITGNTYDVISLAKELCTYLTARWQQLKAGNYDQLLTEYSLHLYKSGCSVTFKKNNKLFTAVVTGVNQQGELLINAGEQLAVPHGSVEWIMPA